MNIKDLSKKTDWELKCISIMYANTSFGDCNSTHLLFYTNICQHKQTVICFYKVSIVFLKNGNFFPVYIFYPWHCSKFWLYIVVPYFDDIECCSNKICYLLIFIHHLKSYPTVVFVKPYFSNTFESMDDN